MIQTNQQRGFSLLEILIAFSILALSLGILLKIFSSGVNIAAVAEEYTAAVQIAESLMIRTGVETPLQAGETSGLDGEHYNWRVVVNPYVLPPDQVDVNALKLALFKVDVTVSWGDGNTGERQIELSTLKLTTEKPS
ncbi:MAG: type II secretion system protein [Methylovulum sp.]|nr:type II secretion system protein [Methylovulum sp.]